MSTVSVRYVVDDVEAAIDFYATHLDFAVQMHPNDAFAMLTRGDLRLVLVRPVEPGSSAGGGAAMPDGTMQRPGGWNRFSIEVPDLEATVRELRAGGASFRNEVVTGVGGKQILVEDPSGNPVELFQPLLDEAWLDTHAVKAGDRAETYAIRPIAWVESALTEVDDAPNQGAEGAPDAWLAFRSDVFEGIRDIGVGTELFVLTWLHRARRDELATHPGDDPSGPELGVFSTRSPNRPNPVGLHRVVVLAVAHGRLQVGPLEAIDGTPVVDVKPVIRSERD